MELRQQELIKSLRDLADYLEKRDFILEGSTGFNRPDVCLFTDGAAFFENIKLLGGFTKEFNEYSTRATRKFGDITFSVYASRETVCEKVEDGVEVIPSEPEKIIPAKPERIVPKYKYKCPESLLKGE